MQLFKNLFARGKDVCCARHKRRKGWSQAWMENSLLKYAKTFLHLNCFTSSFALFASGGNGSSSSSTVHRTSLACRCCLHPIVRRQSCCKHWSRAIFYASVVHLFRLSKFCFRISLLPVAFTRSTRLSGARVHWIIFNKFRLGIMASGIHSLLLLCRVPPVWRLKCELWNCFPALCCTMLFLRLGAGGGAAQLECKRTFVVVLKCIPAYIECPH